MEGISGLHHYGASYYSLADKDPCAERTDRAAICCLQEQALFSGVELPFKPLEAPNLWKKLL